MSNETTLAGMPTKTRNEILWGRKGLPAEFYGKELIAEALFEALKTMDRSTMHGFVSFNEAFRSHHFGVDSNVVDAKDGSIHPSNWHNPDGANISVLGLKHVWGIGSFGTEYGIEHRSITAKPALEDIREWWTTAELQDAIEVNNARRSQGFDEMPHWQIVFMRTKRVFLTKFGRLFVVEVEWEAVTLAPQVYKPNRFRAEQVNFNSLYNVRQKSDIEEFVKDHGLKAGTAVLYGLKLALQSSNYRLREALKPNEKTEAMLSGLLSQISS